MIINEDSIGSQIIKSTKIGSALSDKRDRVEWYGHLVCFFVAESESFHVTPQSGCGLYGEIIILIVNMVEYLRHCGICFLCLEAVKLFVDNK